VDDKNFISSGMVDPVEMLPGVHRRTMVTTDDMMLVEITLDKGAVVPMHRHANHQVGYVISGEIELTIDGVVRVCKPGDSYAMPGNVDHCALAVTDCLVIDIFAPPREDYR
jgi:quercetin dioxygenase-like cupin family protein